jgi:hypothetical protein
MRLRQVIFPAVGLALLVAGSLVWGSRLSYSPEQVLQRNLADRLVEVSSSGPVDLSDECALVATEDGWVLFVLDAKLTSDNQIRTFFETAEEPLGLYVEYDPGLLRLGLGLGPGNERSNTELPIRFVRRDEQATIFIAVTNETTRVVTNARDGRIAWPGYLADEWRCNSVQIADDTRQSTHGFTCKGCDVRLRYATGTDISEIETTLDSLSNVRQFNVRRWSGTSLTLLGLTVLVLTARDISRRRRPLNTSAQTSAG